MESSDTVAIILCVVVRILDWNSLMACARSSVAERPSAALVRSVSLPG